MPRLDPSAPHDRMREKSRIQAKISEAFQKRGPCMVLDKVDAQNAVLAFEPVRITPRKPAPESVRASERRRLKADKKQWRADAGKRAMKRHYGTTGDDT